MNLKESLVNKTYYYKTLCNDSWEDAIFFVSSSKISFEIFYPKDRREFPNGYSAVSVHQMYTK